MARWRIVTRLHRLACYLLKGQSRRSGCAPMTSGLPRQEDKFRARRASHLCRQETYAPQQLAAHSITSSARASSGADRETKRLCRLQIGCQPEASREFYRQVAGCSAPQDFGYIVCRATKAPAQIDTVTHQSASYDVLSIAVDRRQSLLQC